MQTVMRRPRYLPQSDQYRSEFQRCFREDQPEDLPENLTQFNSAEFEQGDRTCKTTLIDALFAVSHYLEMGAKDYFRARIHALSNNLKPRSMEQIRHQDWAVSLS